MRMLIAVEAEECIPLHGKQIIVVTSSPIFIVYRKYQRLSVESNLKRFISYLQTFWNSAGRMQGITQNLLVRVKLLYLKIK